jgi:hypothetical protein
LKSERDPSAPLRDDSGNQPRQQKQEKGAGETPALLHKFGRAAFGPRIVGEAEADAIRDRRVIVEQEDCRRIWVWIGQTNFAEDLERLGGYLA